MWCNMQAHIGFFGESTQHACLDGVLQASLTAVESEFWNVVERADEPVEVLYGADIDTTITGSGFPQQVCFWAGYVVSPAVLWCCAVVLCCSVRPTDLPQRPVWHAGCNGKALVCSSASMSLSLPLWMA